MINPRVFALTFLQFLSLNEVYSPSLASPVETSAPEPIETSEPVLLVGGLDYRPGDLKIEAQAESLSKGLGGRPVKGIRYKDRAGAEAFIRQNPEATVVLFSAGCLHAAPLSALVQDPSRFWILEPYAVSRRTVESIKGALRAGVPEKNIVVGPSRGRGLGPFSGASRTPTGTGHFGALKELGKLIAAH